MTIASTERMSTVRVIILFLSTTFCFYLFHTLIGFLHKVWWKPTRLQTLMSSQGIRGPSYRFPHGNTKQISNMRSQSMEKPMDISHDIFARIQLHVCAWTKAYGKDEIFPRLFYHITMLKVPLCDDREELSKLARFGVPIIHHRGRGDQGGTDEQRRHLSENGNGGRMVPEMSSSVLKMLERWKSYEGKELDVFKEFGLLTTEVISRTAFGSSYTEGKHIFEMVAKLTEITVRNVYKVKFPGIRYLFLKNNDEIESEKLEKGIMDCIVQIITKREMEHVSNPDFLGKLMEANQDRDKKKRISVEEIVDECKTFYFAGHETTTSLLSWTIFLLAVHQEWQDKARNEVTRSFGEANPNPDGIARLKIMNMVIEESLRLYPPVPVIKRKVDKQVKLGKLTLPPQIELYISPLALHHDAKIWGEDVHLFKPERFAERAANNNPASFLPFGFGPELVWD
ncbi:hypothetical protein ACS0TY_008205 [Phlomoides rotata]